MRYGDELRAQRMARGLTLKATAAMIGVSPAAYGGTERNTNGANERTRALLSEWIGEEREAELYAELVERRTEEKAEARGKRRNVNMKNPPLEKRGKTFCVVSEGGTAPKTIAALIAKTERSAWKPA